MALKLNLDGITRGLAAAAAGTGILVKTATSWVTRTLTAPSKGFTITNPAGLAGDPTFVLSHTLAALQTLGTTGTAGLVKITSTDAASVVSDATRAALQTLGTAGTAGMLAQTGTDTYAVRTITDTGLVTVTNGSGAAGAPNIDVTAATQADQETASSTTVAVTPGRQQFHPSAAKCWAYVSVSAGTPTLAASRNITSISDTGIGDLTITIATDFSSANWAAVATADRTGATSVESHIFIQSRAAGSVELFQTNATPVAADPDAWNFVGFGDQ